MTRSKITVLLCLVAGLVSACATVSTSGDYVLESGETVTGDLVITSGNATLEEGSRVTGSVFMTSGNLFADGEVQGDIVITSGSVELGPNAVVHGDIRGTSGRVNRADGARVDGNISTNVSNFTIGRAFFVRFIFLCCVLPLGAILLIIVLLIALARGRRTTPVSTPEPAQTDLPAGDDAALKLRQLKQMLDEGLISAEEYEAKRSDILTAM